MTIIAGNPGITGSISDGSLFLTLPTRGLTVQQIIFLGRAGGEQRLELRQFGRLFANPHALADQLHEVDQREQYLRLLRDPLSVKGMENRCERRHPHPGGGAKLAFA